MFSLLFSNYCMCCKALQPSLTHDYSATGKHGVYCVHIHTVQGQFSTAAPVQAERFHLSGVLLLAAGSGPTQLG